jgi:hypothetical protein
VDEYKLQLQLTPRQVYSNSIDIVSREFRRTVGRLELVFFAFLCFVARTAFVFVFANEDFTKAFIKSKLICV